jgi:hypothetical protein
LWRDESLNSFSRGFTDSRHNKSVLSAKNKQRNLRVYFGVLQAKKLACVDLPTLPNNNLGPKSVPNTALNGD